ncbi:hypothetical protein [Caenispirillum bisanense]|uniref:hypothetical protein n=1 Tax=Caenispirillum bisanense TaxID=414052 RepID=UPI0031D3EB4A
MVAVVGIEMKQGEVRYCVLDGTRQSPTFVEHGVKHFGLPAEAPELMDFFRQTFEEIINTYKPEAVGYRIALSVPPSVKKAEQYPYLYFSCGMLCLICHDNNIPATMFNGNSFGAAFFGGAKGNKMTLCDGIVGQHPPKWDDSARMAALAALGVLS